MLAVPPSGFMPGSQAGWTLKLDAQTNGKPEASLYE